MIYKLFTRYNDGQCRTSWANDQNHAVERMKTIAKDVKVSSISCHPTIANQDGYLVESEDARWLLLQRLPHMGENYTIEFNN